MIHPLVSVLIPCHNAERFIGETLESVFAQTWPNLEVIVVDDGSTDASVQVVERFGERVRLIRQDNRGQTAALNVALEVAQGDFIQYLAADDLISPAKIELQHGRLAECLERRLAEWVIWESPVSEARFQPESVWQDLSPLDWLIESRREGLCMMFPALWLIPKAVVKAAGPWREDLTLNNDSEYFTRVLLAAGNVLFCPGARCYYRSGQAGSLSGRKTSEAWQSHFAAIEACEVRVRAREDAERARRGGALSWRQRAHACYPHAPALAERALARANELHPVVIRPGGGPAFLMLSHLIGWRAARRLQVACGRG